MQSRYASHVLPLLSLAAALTVLSGCASAPAKPVNTKAGDDLYSGQPKAVFGTEFPAGSAAEAAARGDKAIVDGDFDRALYFYVEAIGIDPSDKTTLLKIGAIHRDREDPRLALAAYRRVLMLEADNVQALEGAGLALLELRELEAAQVLLSRAVEHDERRWRAHEGLGVVADLRQDEGWAQAAARHYERALEIQPNAASVHNNLGYSRYLAGDLDAAAAAFERATAIDPDYERAWRNLALVNVKEGEYDEALRILRGIETEAAALNDVGYLAMLEGFYDLAEQYLIDATEASPTFYRVAYENLDRLRALREDAVIVSVGRAQAPVKR